MADVKPTGVVEVKGGTGSVVPPAGPTKKRMTKADRLLKKQAGSGEARASITISIPVELRDRGAAFVKKVNGSITRLVQDNTEEFLKSLPPAPAGFKYEAPRSKKD